MIATLNICAEKHTSCQDSLYVYEFGHSVVGGVFDGCSEGKYSEWASRTFTYAFQGYSDPTSNYTAKMVWGDLRSLSKRFGLGHTFLQSTCLLFYYNKNTKELRIRAFGDGVYYVNGICYNIDQDDKVDYFGDHLEDGEDFNMYLSGEPSVLKHYNDVTNFKICSDGIKRIEISQFIDTDINPVEVLLKDPDSANYLERMWNKLKRKHFTAADDLSIISYVQD